MSAHQASAGVARRFQDGVSTAPSQRARREWREFDTWFRGVYDRSGHRPKKALIVGWYEQHAPLVWASADRPSLQEARDRAKGLGRMLLAGREAGGQRSHRYPLRSHRGSAGSSRRSSAFADSSGRTSSDGDGAGSDSGPRQESHVRRLRPRASTPPPYQPQAPADVDGAGTQQQQQQQQQLQPRRVPPLPSPAQLHASGGATTGGTPEQQQQHQEQQQQHGQPHHHQLHTPQQQQHAPAAAAMAAAAAAAAATAVASAGGPSGSGTPLSTAAHQPGGVCSGEEWCDWEEEPIGMDIFMVGSHMHTD